MKKLFSFLIFLFLVLGLGSLVGLLNTESVNGWYLTLNKPSWTPEKHVFPIVWTILYIMLSVSIWLYWNKLEGSFKEKLNNKGVRFFFIQHFFNLIWSPIFFLLKSPVLALIDISLLYLFIFPVIFTFRKVSKTAGLLLIPYMLWVLNALGLNFTIVLMN